MKWSTFYIYTIYIPSLYIFLKIDLKKKDNFNLLNKIKWIKICTNFAISLSINWRYKNDRPENLKTRRFRCLSWNIAIMVFIKKCHMDRRRYKSRHLIAILIGTHCLMYIWGFIHRLYDNLWEVHCG